MRYNLIPAVFLLSLCVPCASYADTLRLQNGRSITGIIKNEAGDNVVIVVPGGALTFPKTSIRSIERSSSDENRQQRMQWAADSASASLSPASNNTNTTATTGAGITFPDNENRIYIDATLNRVVPVTLLLDTGAPYLIIRREFARRLGVSVDKGSVIEVSLAGKTVKALQTTIRTVNVGGRQNSDVLALILLQDTNFPAMKDGLLGMSFLNNYNFKIDYAARQLILDPKEKQ